jgi:hypothetical protein
VPVRKEHRGRGVLQELVLDVLVEYQTAGSVTRGRAAGSVKIQPRRLSACAADLGHRPWNSTAGRIHCVHAPAPSSPSAVSSLGPSCCTRVKTGHQKDAPRRADAPRSTETRVSSRLPAKMTRAQKSGHSNLKQQRRRSQRRSEPLFRGAAVLTQIGYGDGLDVANQNSVVGKADWACERMISVQQKPLTETRTVLKYRRLCLQHLHHPFFHGRSVHGARGGQTDLDCKHASDDGAAPAEQTRLTMHCRGGAHEAALGHTEQLLRKHSLEHDA